jgi:hypothetical protein
MIAVDEFDTDSSASGADHVAGADRHPDRSDDEGPDRLRDTELQSEIELVAELVVAASTSEGALSTAEIDRILGVQHL